MTMQSNYYKSASLSMDIYDLEVEIKEPHATAQIYAVDSGYNTCDSCNCSRNCSYTGCPSDCGCTASCQTCTCYC